MKQTAFALSTLAALVLVSGCSEPETADPQAQGAEQETAMVNGNEVTMVNTDDLLKEVAKPELTVLEQRVRDDSATMIERTAALKLMEKEVRRMAGLGQASDFSQCRLLAVGSRPCGGPDYYMAYSTATVDAEKLEAAAQRYSELQRLLNDQQSLVSTCEVAAKPKLTMSGGLCRAVAAEVM